ESVSLPSGLGSFMHDVRTGLPSPGDDWAGSLAAGAPSGGLPGAGLLLLLLLVPGLALLAWKARGDGREAAGRRAELGPWPVKPSAVASRDDFIRAFEYLALLCLGPEARSYNHREVAARLGGADDGPAGGRREAAER